MRAAAALTRRTGRQVLGIKRLVGFGLLELAPAAIFLLSAAELRADRALERLVDVAVGLYFPLLLPIVALVLGASALGDERRDHTLSFVVLRPMPRWAIGAAKLAGAGVAAVLLNAIGVLALGLVAGIRFGFWHPTIPLLAGAAVATVAYVALFVPLGYLTDRAVLIGLAFVFVFENGVVSALSGLAGLSPWRLGLGAFAGLASPDVAAAIPGAALGDLVPGAAGATLKTLILLLISLGALTALLTRRDLA